MEQPRRRAWDASYAVKKTIRDVLFSLLYFMKRLFNAEHTQMLQ